MRRFGALLAAAALGGCAGAASIVSTGSRLNSVSKGEGDRPIWDVRCPPIGTVVRYSDGKTITWAGEDPADDMACLGRDLAGNDVRWILGLLDISREHVGMYRAALAGMFPARPKAKVSFRVRSASGSGQPPGVCSRIGKWASGPTRSRHMGVAFRS